MAKSPSPAFPNYPFLQLLKLKFTKFKPNLQFTGNPKPPFILIMVMIRLSKIIMVIMKMVMIFCMPELARILKQQSYPNGPPCLIVHDLLIVPNIYP